MKRGIILSVQPSLGGPFDNHECIRAFCEAAKLFGAVALKLTDKWLPFVRNCWVGDIIAIKKSYLGNSQVVITNNISEMQYLFDAGADYVATSDLGALASARQMGHSNLIFEADCFEQAVQATAFNPAFISTTMCGYTERTRHVGEGPAIEFVRNASRLGPPIIAEGRYSTREQVRAAFTAGAYALCMGTAVTRPDVILKGFCDEAFPAAANRG